MLYVLLWMCVITARAHSGELALPQDVHVNNSLLTWTPAHQHNNVTYTVQYRSTESERWKDVQSCETALTSCDVTRTQKAAKYGCVALRVQAHKLNSAPVEACTKGDSCGPSVSLSALPGILSVTLSSKHRLMRDHTFAEYWVYYGLEDQPQEEYEIYAPDSTTRSSVSIKELDEGRRYCVYVQIVLYGKVDVGPPSCLKCMVIPESGNNLAKIITSVIVVIILVVLSVAMAYVLLHQQKRINRIKQWFKPEPPPEALCPLPDHHRPLIAAAPPLEDQYDRISFIQEEQGLTSVQET